MGMDDLFDGIAPFVHVARAGSFRGAALAMGVTPAAVSKAIQRLEQRLGVKLFQRTTRRVALTVEGTYFLGHCQEAMSQLRMGREQVALHQALAMGEVTLSMPLILGRFVLQRLPRFVERYPALQLHLRFSDRFVDLVEEQSDVALRIGQLEDSSMIGRVLSQTRWCTVASPRYLARRGEPKHPDELKEHACLKFHAPTGRNVEWTFQLAADEKPQMIETPTSLDLDQGEMLIEAALAGLGLCQAFGYMVQTAIREGQLVEVLREYAAPGAPIHALCTAGQQHNPRVRALIDFLVEAFQEG